MTSTVVEKATGKGKTIETVKGSVVARGPRGWKDE